MYLYIGHVYAYETGIKSGRIHKVMAATGLSVGAAVVTFIWSDQVKPLVDVIRS